MVWGRPQFEIATQMATRRSRVRKEVRSNVLRMTWVAAASVMVMTCLEAVVMEAAVMAAF